MAGSALMLFCLEAGRELAERVGKVLGITLSPHEEREFEHGQHKSRPLVSVRRREVYVLQSLHGGRGMSVNDLLCRLLFFIGALRDAGAEHVTAVVPFLAYARKDRKTKPRDPVTTRYVAALFEAVGTDRVVTLDVHNLAAFQNAFRCRTDHLESTRLFVEHFAARVDGEITVVSPDAGGVKRADAFRQGLARALGRPVALAFMEKERSEGTVGGAPRIEGVRDRAAIIVDDMISTGTTLRRAARACRDAGARSVRAAAAHGAFVEGAEALLADPALDQIVVLDTIPPAGGAERAPAGRLVRLDAAPLFAEAIRRLHEGGSLVDLLAV